MEPEGFKPQTFKPTVVEVTPNQSFSWLGDLPIPGLFDGKHQFRLEALQNGHTRVHHSENFDGVLWMINPERFRPSFDMMNNALKKRVEFLSSQERIST